jgi:hypothetical protein
VKVVAARLALLGPGARGLAAAAQPRHRSTRCCWPPLGDVLQMLGELVQRAQVREALAVSAAEGAGGLPDRGSRSAPRSAC